MSTQATAKELSWFPCYPDRLLASGKWQAMKDFQRGWYWHLLVLMTRSKPLGKLPLDGRLWVLAGAHSKQYFEQHSALVLACFKIEESDGLKWIYSEPLQNVLNEQTYRRDMRQKAGRLGGQAKQTRSKSSLIYSLEFLTIWENNNWKAVGKPKAYKAFQKSLEVIQQEKKIRADQALEFLADAMEEFKTSPAGKDGGMFQDYSAPHPASWLNAQRYFDDRRTWRPGGSTGANPAGQNGTAAKTKSFSDPACPICKGSSWAQADGGRVQRCECFKRNRAKAISESGSA